MRAASSSDARCSVRRSGRTSGHSGESDRPPTSPGLAAMPLIGEHVGALTIHLPVPPHPRPHPRPRPHLLPPLGIIVFVMTWSWCRSVSCPSKNCVTCVVQLSGVDMWNALLNCLVLVCCVRGAVCGVPVSPPPPPTALLHLINFIF